MVSHRLSMDERTALIMSMLSNPNEVEVVGSLSRGDAQAFVDTIDEVCSHTVPCLNVNNKATESFAFRRSGDG